MNPDKLQFLTNELAAILVEGNAAEHKKMYGREPKATACVYFATAPNVREVSRRVSGVISQLAAWSEPYDAIQQLCVWHFE